MPQTTTPAARPLPAAYHSPRGTCAACGLPPAPPAAPCPCDRCQGDGELLCGHCNGNGTLYPERPRAARCYKCGGRGMVACSTCDGTGEIQGDDESEGEQ